MPFWQRNLLYPSWKQFLPIETTLDGTTLIPTPRCFVVKGKNGATRKYATPGSQYPGYTFRSTWQWNEESNAWDCKEFRKKWKLLHEPHETFQGTRVWALQVFQRSDTARVAKVASRGTLLVDTGSLLFSL